MILIESLLYKIDQRLNKLSTNYHQQIPLEDKILALNEAQISLVKNKLGQNNVYKIGLEGFKKRYQDLQFLIENAEDHKLSLKEKDKALNKWSVSTEKLPNFMFYVDSYLIASKGDCKERVIATNADLVKHSDLITLLKDSNYKPSFEYQETLVDVNKDEIHVYTDGTFELNNIFVSYLRYPKKVDFEGYLDFKGIPSQTINSELEEYLEDELLDITVRNLAYAIENNNAVQAANQKINTNE